MRDTFALATVLTLKSDPWLPSHLFKSVRVPYSQSNLKSPETLATANILTHFIISIAVLENVPLSRVTEKSNFSTLNVGLAGTGNQSRATCMAGSVSRRSAIHYVFGNCFCASKFLSDEKGVKFARFVLDTLIEKHVNLYLLITWSN
jgi:hypothetical protein